MPNIIPFPAVSKTETAPPSYREPTADEQKQIAECLERMQAHILRLRNELVNNQAEIAVARVEVERLLFALTSKSFQK